MSLKPWTVAFYGCLFAGAGIAASPFYYVCEDIGGTCRFLRQDIEINVNVSP